MTPQHKRAVLINMLAQQAMQNTHKFLQQWGNMPTPPHRGGRHVPAPAGVAPGLIDLIQMMVPRGKRGNYLPRIQAMLYQQMHGNLDA